MNVTKPDIEALYGEESERARKRYAHLQEKFTEEFGEAELRYFSAPGRTEIIGNHTDHNGGQILAGSITLDTICAAAPTDDGIITIVSEGYRRRTARSPWLPAWQRLRRISAIRWAVSAPM